MRRGHYLSLVVIFLLSAATVGLAEPAKEKEKKGPANRLAKESSPYLLQHAHNPVDWFPWGPEAFAKAKKEDKLIFLSIGYSSCHWCHVMERESFDNKEIAKILNENFVCIKVDREERPEVDNIYMTALNVLGQRGGWPLSMFLTSEGKPIVGGTYWPPEDKGVGDQKVTGFKSILKIMLDSYKEKPKEMLKHADELAENTATALTGTARGIALVELNRELVTGVVDGLKEEFDKTHGGFGSSVRQFRGPKFPIPSYLLFLQAEATRAKSAELNDMIQLTLDKMALGGIYDHLGGGFHRYSTERTWTVPHFEKMLYDNAQLTEVYANAYRTSKNPLYRKVVQESLAYISREMTSPEGAFYSALDADTEEEEGKFYVWTRKEIEDILGDKESATLLCEVYQADGKPNFEGKYHILCLAKPLSEIAKDRKTTEKELEAKLAPLRQKLFDVRAKRPRPFLDTKVLTAWNGQMIAGYAVAGKSLEEPKYTQVAARAADFLLKNLRTKDGRLLRTYGAAPGQKPEARLNAYLDDYAFLVHGLLCLHDATGEKKWLDEAKSLTETMMKWHSDKPGGFYYTSSDHEKLFARAKDQYDGAQPSANSIAAQNLVRLWIKTGDESYKEQAEKSFKVFATTLRTNPTALSAMAHALGMFLDAPKAPKK